MNINKSFNAIKNVFLDKRLKTNDNQNFNISNNSLLDKFSIKKKITFLIISMCLTTFIVCTILSYLQIYNAVLVSQKFKVGIVTEMALNLIKEYKAKVDKGELSEEDAKKAAIERIDHLRYEGDNYVWINDYNCIFVAHPKKQGKSAAKMKDKNNLYVIVEATKIAREKGKGTLKYFWGKPGKPENQTFEKLSYVRNFAPWGWVIGSGVYLDDIFMSTINEVKGSIIIIMLVNLGIILIAVILGNISIGRSIILPIINVTKISKRLAENDLNVIIPEDNNNTEIGELHRSFKKFLDNLKNIIQQINDTAHELSSNSQEMQTATEQVSQGAEQVAISVNQLASGANQVSQSIEDSANNLNKTNNTIQAISQEAHTVAKIGDDTESTANTGKEQVDKAVDKIKNIKDVSGKVSSIIGELGKMSSEIETIVDLIKNIASQTNLLALNAAIEAARAENMEKDLLLWRMKLKSLQNNQVKLLIK